jgi:hypothetical protein
LQGLHEFSELCLRLGIAFIAVHQDSNPPHASRLLRARRNRPSRCRTTEQPDQVAPSHVPPSSQGTVYHTVN